MRSRTSEKRFLAATRSRAAAASRAVCVLAAGAAVLAAVASHAAEAGGAAASPSTAGSRGASVGEITFRAEGGNREIVCIRFDRLLIPVVWSIEGRKPRVVIDADPVVRAAKIPATMKVNGNLVRAVRCYLNVKKQRLRVVLDMHAGRNYYVDQTFREADNLYCLTVTEQAPAAEESKAGP